MGRGEGGQCQATTGSPSFTGMRQCLECWQLHHQPKRCVMRIKGGSTQEVSSAWEVGSQLSHRAKHYRPRVDEPEVMNGYMLCLTPAWCHLAGGQCGSICRLFPQDKPRDTVWSQRIQIYYTCRARWPAPLNHVRSTRPKRNQLEKSGDRLTLELSNNGAEVRGLLSPLEGNLAAANGGPARFCSILFHAVQAFVTVGQI
jgi:hypothetical protein